MIRPLVAIVGKPNVGKSTFFNRLAGRRIAIVEDTPGVTRDRLYADVEWDRRYFTLVDTGGIDPSGDIEMYQMLKEQAEMAMDLAEVIVFFVDGREGMTRDDEDVAKILRNTRKPVVLAVNKMDNPEKFDNAYEFYALGLGDPHPMSATLGLGIGELLDAICQHMPVMDPSELEEKTDTISIAVVGKPNVGKSSLVNALLGQNRVIVSDVAGTTRDAIDVGFVSEGQEYLIIDTAGLRRKRSIEEQSIERYGVIRSLDAIRRSDVSLIVLDATQDVSEQDVRIAGYAHEQGKGSIIIVNKWDLIEKDSYTMKKYREKLITSFSFMDYVPMLFISAKTGQRLFNVLNEVLTVYEQCNKRVSTGLLNEVMQEAINTTEPPSDKGRRLRIYYSTQVSVQPPTFMLSVNDPELLHFSYRRYLENYLRKSFGFEGTPIHFVVRSHNEKREG